MNFAKSIKRAGAAIVLMLGAQASLAATIVDFETEVRFGPYAGTVGVGHFTYDESMLSGVDLEVAAPVGATDPDVIAGALIEFELTILGQTFIMTDDVDFPELPVVEFVDGVLDFADFLVVDFAPTDIVEDGVEELGVVGPLVDTASGVFIEGFVTTVTVPEPAVLALMGIGLAGFGWKRARR